jgi:hypothetical protein
MQVDRPAQPVHELCTVVLTEAATEYLAELAATECEQLARGVEARAVLPTAGDLHHRTCKGQAQ